MDWNLWLKGLLAGVIGAVAGALFDLVGGMVANGGVIDWHHVETVAIGTAAVAVLGYLKRSPLPPGDALPGGQRATDPPPVPPKEK